MIDVEAVDGLIGEGMIMAAAFDAGQAATIAREPAQAITSFQMRVTSRCCASNSPAGTRGGRESSDR